MTKMDMHPFEGRKIDVKAKPLFYGGVNYNCINTKISFFQSRLASQYGSSVKQLLLYPK